MIGRGNAAFLLAGAKSSGDQRGSSSRLILGVSAYIPRWPGNTPHPAHQRRPPCQESNPSYAAVGGHPLATTPSSLWAFHGLGYMGDVGTPPSLRGSGNLSHKCSLLSALSWATGQDLSFGRKIGPIRTAARPLPMPIGPRQPPVSPSGHSGRTPGARFSHRHSLTRD